MSVVVLKVRFLLEKSVPFYTTTISLYVCLSVSFFFFPDIATQEPEEMKRKCQGTKL